MHRASNGSVLLIAGTGELPAARRVWGTGGWMVPEEREALDWLTLFILLGWRVDIAWVRARGFGEAVARDHDWIVVGCPVEALSPEERALLTEAVARRAMNLLTRAGAKASLLGSGRPVRPIAAWSKLAWTGPGVSRRWPLRRCDTALSALSPSAGESVWVTLGETPVAVARRRGLGTEVTLGFHPSSARDAASAFSALLRHLLIAGAPRPLEALDLAGTLVLRMDDPGGAQNVHLASWSHAKLGRSAWNALADTLARRDARLSIGYVAGWVDDGDDRRGALEIDGCSVLRVPGAVYPSRLVRYHDRAGHAPGTSHDYVAERAGIEALRRAGLGEVELHGYTHMHPDTAAWARSPDRYEAVHWFREFGSTAAPVLAAMPLERQPLRLAAQEFARAFGTSPRALIFPGDAWTNEAIGPALDLGLDLVNSYYTALRYRDRFCWCAHLCAPYIDEAAAEWFSSDLPVVGYFHDRDLALRGSGWLRRCLDAWRDAGARRFTDFRELAARLTDWRQI